MYFEKRKNVNIFLWINDCKLAQQKTFKHNSWRDLRIYAENIDARLYHYKESNTRIETDAIFGFSDGEHGAIEIKLGAKKAVLQLKKFYNLAEVKLKFMCIICGLYNAIVKRLDGIYVFPITVLRN